MLPDGELWGDPFTMQVALRTLQIVGDHTNGAYTHEIREVARGLMLVNNNAVAQRLGKMIDTLVDTAVTAQKTGSGEPLDWEKVRL
jgi:phosphoribosylanthranilate isomerase